MGKYGLLRRGNVVTKLMKLLMVRLSGNLFNLTESQKKSHKNSNQLPPETNGGSSGACQETQGSYVFGLCIPGG